MVIDFGAPLGIARQMTELSTSTRAKAKWAILIALCSGQFIMVLDSTVMNVSIQRVIEDLDTTVSKMQLAIATYTLTTAALMLIGGKIGDIIGGWVATAARPADLTPFFSHAKPNLQIGSAGDPTKEELDERPYPLCPRVLDGGSV
jgi:hypothetical protein